MGRALQPYTFSLGPETPIGHGREVQHEIIYVPADLQPDDRARIDAPLPPYEFDVAKTHAPDLFQSPQP